MDEDISKYAEDNNTSFFFRCIVDSTFRFIDEDSDKKTRKFTLKAFHFMNTKSVVYLHAFVRVCNSSNETLVHALSIFLSLIDFCWLFFPPLF